ncbi:unnamed protein product [Cuscuta campestris]|uniref:Uncharacterized protein n=1 Tax=Cuscuta campestris TaxID=132261 RepID=A0A484MA72_9ASTE|nr:unnamed protein product [Cuscuta campestris]
MPTTPPLNSHTPPTKAPSKIANTDEEFLILLDEERLLAVSEVLFQKADDQGHSTHSTKKKAKQSGSNPIQKKNILPQRNIDLEDFALKTTLIPLLDARNLLKSVTLPGSYVKQAINHFLGLDDDKDELVGEVTRWKELTHGARNIQHPSNKVPSSTLKSSYFIVLRGFVKEDAEKEEPLEPLLHIDNRHFDGRHFNNMETVPHQATRGVHGLVKFLDLKLQKNKEELHLVDQQRITLEEERRHLIWLHEHVAHGAQAEEASSQGESTEWEDDTTTHCSLLSLI